MTDLKALAKGTDAFAFMNALKELAKTLVTKNNWTDENDEFFFLDPYSIEEYDEEASRPTEVTLNDLKIKVVEAFESGDGNPMHKVFSFTFAGEDPIFVRRTGYYSSDEGEIWDDVEGDGDGFAFVTPVTLTVTRYVAKGEKPPTGGFY
jgi:hypothetical protein